MQFNPPKITDIASAQRAVQELSVVINFLLENRLEVISVAPAKPRNGLYFADGTAWNPGAGRGLYLYDESTGLYTKL